MKYRLLVSIVAGLLLSLLVIRISDSQVSQLSGLAVAQSKKWVGLRDAGVGDNISDGVGAFSLMMYDSVNGVFNRLRGSTNFGILVDVARIQGSIIVTGNKTLADNFANPTDAILTGAFNMFWDGANWQRAGTSNLLVTTVTNGSNLAYATAGGIDMPNNLVKALEVESITAKTGLLLIVPKAKPSVRQVSAVNSINTISLGPTTGFNQGIYSLTASCSSGTATLTITNGSSVIIWAAPVPAAPSVYQHAFPVPLISVGSSATTVSVSSCGVGNTSDLSVQGTAVR